MNSQQYWKEWKNSGNDLKVDPGNLCKSSSFESMEQKSEWSWLERECQVGPPSQSVDGASMVLIWWVKECLFSPHLRLRVISWGRKRLEGLLLWKHWALRLIYTKPSLYCGPRFHFQHPSDPCCLESHPQHSRFWSGHGQCNIWNDSLIRKVSKCGIQLKLSLNHSEQGSHCAFIHFPNYFILMLYIYICIYICISLSDKRNKTKGKSKTHSGVSFSHVFCSF